MIRRVISLAALSFVAASAVLVQAQPVDPGAEGPLASLLAPEPGKRICFARDYDAAHMASHPQQRVRSMSFRLAYHAHEPDAFYPNGQRTYYFRLAATLRRREEALSPRVLRRTLEELRAIVDPGVSEVEGGRRAQGVAEWYGRATAAQRHDIHARLSLL